MKVFDKRFFQQFDFTPEQLHNYERSAIRDLEIAKESNIPEVVFKFAYDALLKLAIFQAAKSGYRVRSIPGHHVKLLDALALAAESKELAVLAEDMRQKRNRELYDGFILSETDCRAFLIFVCSVFSKML